MSRKLDYNRIADGQRFCGMRFDELLRCLAADAAKLAYRCQCKDNARCVHVAAASLDGMFRIVDHPDDCPDCARINSRRKEEG